MQIPAAMSLYSASTAASSTIEKLPISCYDNALYKFTFDFDFDFDFM